MFLLPSASLMHPPSFLLPCSRPFSLPSQPHCFFIFSCGLFRYFFRFFLSCCFRFCFCIALKNISRSRNTHSSCLFATFLRDLSGVIYRNQIPDPGYRTADRFLHHPWKTQAHFHYRKATLPDPCSALPASRSRYVPPKSSLFRCFRCSALSLFPMRHFPCQSVFPCFFLMYFLSLLQSHFLLSFWLFLLCCSSPASLLPFQRNFHFPCCSLVTVCVSVCFAVSVCVFCCIRITKVRLQALRLLLPSEIVCT